MKAELIGDLKCTLPSPLFNQVEFSMNGERYFWRCWCDDNGKPVSIDCFNDEVNPFLIEELITRLQRLHFLGLLKWK